MAVITPFKSTGFPDKRLKTCSASIRGQNRGCPMWGKCIEKSKGQHPVRVAYKDYTSRSIRFMSCEEWQRTGRFRGDEKMERCKIYPEEHYVITRQFERPGAPRGERGSIVSSAELRPSLPEAVMQTHPITGNVRPTIDLLDKQFGENKEEPIKGDPRGDGAGPLGNVEELPDNMMLQDSEVSFDDTTQRKDPVAITVPGVRIVGGKPVAGKK